MLSIAHFLIVIRQSVFDTVLIQALKLCVKDTMLCLCVCSAHKVRLLSVLTRKRCPEKMFTAASHLGLCVLLTKSVCDQSQHHFQNKIKQRRVPGVSLWPSAAQSSVQQGVWMQSWSQRG